VDTESFIAQQFAGRPEPGEDPAAELPPAEEFFPGSRVSKVEFYASRKAVSAPQKAAERRWDRNPRIQAYRGANVEFFTIGALAEALGKKPVTIRSWITKGWLPPARFRTPSIPGTRGNAGRRLWTRGQIETIVSVATKCGVLEEWQPDREKLDLFARSVREELASANSGA